MEKIIATEKGGMRRRVLTATKRINPKGATSLHGLHRRGDADLGDLSI
jgi:hypothetical protein